MSALQEVSTRRRRTGATHENRQTTQLVHFTAVSGKGRKNVCRPDDLISVKNFEKVVQLLVLPATAVQLLYN